MGFDSLGYYFFLYGVVCLLWLWRPKAWLLLVASLVFYASFSWKFLPLLVAMSWVAHQGALRLGGSKSKGQLAALLAVTFLPLACWKIMEAGGTSLVFPLGISFFTFHCASYLIDAYRGTATPERSFLKVLLYVSFFPQLVAGPITRAREILPQLAELHRPKGPEARRALWRIYLGLLKKLAIANVLGVVVKEVYANPSLYHGSIVLAAVLFGRYFIYADFSGYTDIAVGSARLLGISLPENFNRPFAAPSIGEYWRRWHMTLSSWIRDYLFYPLAASPLGIGGAYPLVISTFLFLGLWHGLSVNFLLYGLWHGIFLCLHDATRPLRERVWKALGLKDGIVARYLFPWFTFLFLVCPPTILFLSRTPEGALDFIHALSNNQGIGYVKGIGWYHHSTAHFTIIGLEAFQWLNARVNCFERFEKLPFPVRWLVTLLALAWLALAGEFTSNLNFLYFQF